MDILRQLSASSGPVANPKIIANFWKGFQIWDYNSRTFRIQPSPPKITISSENVPPFIYKGCSEFLIKALTYIFNLVITYKVHSAPWKIVKVTPIPKTPDPSCNDITNFGPISILLVPEKIFESIINQKILHQVKNVISYSNMVLCLAGLSLLIYVILYLPHKGGASKALYSPKIFGVVVWWKADFQGACEADSSQSWESRRKHKSANVEPRGWGE